jgi:cell division ftsK/spoIIIE
MKKETINDMIIELDKLFFDREEKFKNLEKIYYKNNVIKKSDYEEYQKKKYKIKKSYEIEIKEILNLLQNECTKVRKSQPSLLELSENNIKEKIKIPKKIALGKLKIESKLISKEIYAPQLLDFPFDKNFIISDDKIKLLHKVLLRLLYALPLGKLELFVYDPIGLGKTIQNFNNLFDNPVVFPAQKILKNSNEFREELEKIQDYIQDLFQNKFKKVDNWKDYNQYMESKGEIHKILPFKIFIISNIPNGLNNEIFGMFKSILEHSEQCGFLILFSVDKIMLDEENIELSDKRMVKELKKILENCKPLNNILNYTNENFKTKIFNIKQIGEKLPDIERIKTLTSKYIEKFENIMTKTQSFEELMKWGKIFDRNSITELKFPIGYKVSNGEILELKIDDTVPHYLIGGRTGSGKSNLLHNLILSASLRYSPEELKIFLIDFKDGVEFNKYTEPELPQGELIAKEIDVEYGKIVLDELIKEMKKRSTLFKDMKVNNYIEYRKKSNDILPRILVIIDEFQDLLLDNSNDEVKLKFTELSRKARSAGIHMILATQSLSGLNFDSIGRQFKGRIVLSSTDEDSVMYLDDKSASNIKMKEEAIVKSSIDNEDYAEKIKVMYASPEKLEHILLLLDNRKTEENKVLIYDGSKFPEFPSSIKFSDKSNGLKLGTNIDYKSTNFILNLKNKKDENLTIYSSNEKIKTNLLKSIILSSSFSNEIKEIIYFGERDIKNIFKYSKIEGINYLNENICKKIKNISGNEIFEKLKECVENKNKKIFIFEDIDLVEILGMKYESDKNDILDYMQQEINKEGSKMLFLYSKLDKKNRGQKITNEMSNYMLINDLNSDDMGKLISNFKSKNVNFDKRMMYIENKEFKRYMRPYMEE